MNLPPIVAAEKWSAAREALLTKEKEATRARDALAAERRRMPMMAVEKEYTFEGPDGSASLLDLFDGRRQLIVYRFFFEPGVEGWPDRGCGGCSMYADQISPLAHVKRPRHDDGRGFCGSPGEHRASPRISVWANGTAPTPSCETATGCFARTS